MKGHDVQYVQQKLQTSRRVSFSRLALPCKAAHGTDHHS